MEIFIWICPHKQSVKALRVQKVIKGLGVHRRGEELGFKVFPCKEFKLRGTLAKEI